MPEPDWDALLRDGVRGLPSVPVSADFDARVLAALCQPPSWRERVWLTLRPLLAGTACSLALTLAALFWTLRAPLTVSPVPGFAASAARPSDAPRPDLASLDRWLDRPNLSAASLADWPERPALLDAPADAPAPERRPPPPRRRASLAVPSVLMA